MLKTENTHNAMIKFNSCQSTFHIDGKIPVLPSIHTILIFPTVGICISFILSLINNNLSYLGIHLETFQIRLAREVKQWHKLEPLNSLKQGVNVSNFNLSFFRLATFQYSLFMFSFSLLPQSNCRNNMFEKQRMS